MKILRHELQAALHDRLLRPMASVLRRWPIIGYSEWLPPSGPRGRALLSYLTLPLLPPPALRDRTRFSNRGIAQELARVLNELGYVVDIVDAQNASWKPHRRYDLFVGHGGANFERLSRHLPRDGKRIYFATGIFWREMNDKAALRMRDFAARNGRSLPLERLITDSEDFGVRESDAVVCLGNDHAAESYRRAGARAVFPLNNATYPAAPELARKDFATAAKRFLFFSGPGNVHKGLDLVLEVFCGRSDVELHVCQQLDPEFATTYEDALFGRPNVRTHGFIAMRSRLFLDLVEQCHWVVLPTCGEGQPGSVVECVAHGLAPIVSRDANIDVGELGLLLDGCTVEEVAAAIDRAARTTPEDCARQAARCVAAGAATYGVDAFRARLRQAIEAVVRG